MIPVVIAFTSNYLIPAATLIHSVLLSSSSSFEFICLTGETLPDRQKKMLEEMTEGRVVFRYVDTLALPDGVYVDPRYSVAAEYRLLLPELLPDYDKVIYVDCDVIVRKDLAECFLSTDLGNGLLAAVFEREGYFNSGFLLMNLAQMREEGTSSRLLDVLKTDYLEFPDQDALNQVCKGRTVALSPSYNGIRTFWLPQYKNDFLSLYSESDYSEMVNSGNIHYSGGKPWNIFTVRFGDWWAEYSQLPEELRREWTPSTKIRLISGMYSKRLGRFCIDSARALYRRARYKV